MVKLPENARNAWEDRNGPVVLSTVDANGTPNSIWASCVRLLSDARIVVADNFFDKTRANILAGSSGSILFMTKKRESFQVKGSIDYQKDGETFDDMKTWNGARPGHAVAVLNVEEVYSGAEKLA